MSNSDGMGESLASKSLTVVTVFKDNPSDVDSVTESLWEVGFTGTHLLWDGGSSPFQKQEDSAGHWTTISVLGEDSGPFDAMNRALDLVNTKYVLFMNAGDAFHSDVSLDFLLNTLEANADTRWLVGRAISTARGHEVGPWPAPDFPQWIRRLGVQSWNHQSIIYETELLREVGGFSGGEILADWTTNVLLERSFKPKLLDYVIALFDTGGISSNLEGQRWIREHANSWVTVFGGRYFLELLTFSLGLAIKSVYKFKVARQALFRARNRWDIRRAVLVGTLSFLAEHRKIRSGLMQALRILGLYDILFRRVSKLAGQGSAKPIIETDSLNANSHTEPKSNNLAGIFGNFLVVDDLICQLAPNRGIERVWSSFLGALSQMDGVQIVILSRTGRLDAYGHKVVPLTKLEADQVENASSEIDDAINNLQLSGRVVFASTYYTLSLRWPNLTIVHDLIPELFGMSGSAIWRQRILSFQNSEILIALSQNTMDDFAKLYPDQFEKISLIRMGVDSDTFRPRGVLAQRRALHKYGIPFKPYLLYVGARSFYKDAKKLIWLTKQKRWSLNVVFVGGEYLVPREKTFWIQPDDSDLPSLYSGAVATVITSEYEGFGFPALESSACGTPVICENNSSLAEASLGRAIFVKDFKLEETLEAIKRAEELKTDISFVAELSDLARSRTWEPFAREFRAIAFQNY